MKALKQALFLVLGFIFGLTGLTASAQTNDLAPAPMAVITLDNQSEIHLKVGQTWPVMRWQGWDIRWPTYGSDFGGTASAANDWCNVTGFIGPWTTWEGALGGAKNTGGVITPNMAGCWRRVYAYGYSDAATGYQMSNISFAYVFIDPN